MRDAADEPPAKRVKLDTSSECNTESRSSQVSSTTLGRPISPPLSRRRSPAIAPPSDINSWSFDNIPEASERAISKQTTLDTPSGTVVKHKSLEYVASPVQLTRISDLAPRQNVDTVGLVDILGNPMIKECWNFNYLFDIDFVM